MKMIQMGGTCTGEHGIGSGKIQALVAETGAEAVNVMKSIKQTLDPSNILNPGKVFN
jgi:D-lactate dehydrogenase (cytochrome)